MVTDKSIDTSGISNAKENFQILFKTMAQGVVYQNSEGHITAANPAAERILGLTLDQMRGRTSEDPRWKAIHENGSEFPGETHPSMVALKTGKEVCNTIMGVFNPLKDDWTWININAVPQFRENEKLSYQVYTTFEDITQRKLAEDKLKAALLEKEILLKELHHRVKNNLSMILSLISLHKYGAVGEELSTSLLDLQKRIHSISLIHDKLYASTNLQEINIAQYLEELVTSNIASFCPCQDLIKVSIDCENIIFTLNLCIPFGLIVNELITNTLKYAFPGVQPGVMEISLTEKENTYLFMFSDNGIGIPKSVDIENPESIGLQLINVLLKQIKGNFVIDSSKGTKYTITFPK